MANAISPAAPAQETILFLDPGCNPWDRQEWDSLWSLAELQAPGWQYLNTSKREDGWVHRFVNGRQWLEIPAYRVWAMCRSPRLE